MVRKLSLSISTDQVLAASMYEWVQRKHTGTVVQRQLFRFLIILEEQSHGVVRQRSVARDDLADPVHKPLGETPEIVDLVNTPRHVLP